MRGSEGSHTLVDLATLRRKKRVECVEQDADDVGAIVVDGST